MLDSLLVGFLQAKEADPSRVAIHWAGHTLSYEELDDCANRIAAQLLAQRLQEEAFVGIATSRGPGFIAAMLGVMKAGLAWVPLDPAYPPQRLADMLEDSGLRHVLVDAGSRDRIPAGPTLLEVSLHPQAAPPSRRPLPRPGQLAYMIYTSGSTGKPKGTLVEHGSVAATVVGMRDAFGVGAADRVLQFSSMSFDASICEVGIALCCGASLVVANESERIPGPDLVKLLVREQASVAVLPPSVVAALPDAQLPQLRTLVCAGEALSAELAERWGRSRRLINAYGPTEAAICATAGEVAPEPRRQPDIGAPLPGVQLEVVDEQLRAVADGEIGELLIGGCGVGRGYWRRPELSAQRFLLRADGRRVYRTGDLVRRLSGGRYEFIGRVDHQLKINGFRIEPGEIAEVLRRQHGVRDAVVVARGGRLVAYVAGDALQPAALLQWARTQLPAHMVPAAAVILPALPITNSGKVDRDALPEPNRDSAGLPSLQVPLDATEREVAQLMGELLGVREIGRADNFFELGGHSLLVGRLAARLRKAFGVEVPLTRIYETPSVAGIAALLQSAAGQRGDAPPAPPPLARAAAPEQSAPLSFPQERIWFLEQMAPGNLAYQAQASLRLRGPLDHQVLNQALTAIVARHEIFRTAFKAADGVPRQEIGPAFAVDVPVMAIEAETTAAFEREAAAIIHREVRQRLRPDAAPLVRWLLLRHTARDHILLHMEHHLIHDGWSFAVFVEELEELYAALVAGRPAALAPPALQFADYARWQRAWLQGPALQAYVDHWCGRLRDLPQPLALPYDTPRPPLFRFSGDALRAEFAPAEYAALREAARAQGVTLYTVMLTGFAVLLARYAGQEDLVIGAGSANRRMSEAERLIGMMINTLPLRVQLQDDPSFSELLQRVHRAAAEAYAWQDVPLDRVVDALSLPRDPSRNPLFSVIFSFHDAAVPDLEFAGLQARVQVEHNGSAKADLNIVVIPRAEQRIGRAARDEDQELTIIWEYADDLFGRASMEAMLRAYRDLLAAAASQPGERVSRLRCASSTEEGNASAAEDCASAADLFAAMVAANPGAVAVQGPGGTCITYSQLDAAAQDLASTLRKEHARAGAACVRVPFGWRRLVAWTACLKLGLPIAPELGKDGRAASGVVIEADAAGDGFVLARSERAAGAADEVPSITWPALAAAAAALREAGFAPRCTLQLPGDQAVEAISLATTLLSGGSLALASLSADDPAAIAAAASRLQTADGTRLALVVPTPLANRLACLGAAALPANADILALGAGLHASAFPSAWTVLQGWGTAKLPLITLQPRWADGMLGRSHDSIGRPLRGIRHEILDAHGLPVPPGAPGELHAGCGREGAPVAMGARVRRHADGSLQCLGDAHTWFTAAGQRVHPCVAREALRSHPGVLDAVVLVRGERLVAYVAAADPSLTPAVLRSHVADRISASELPHAWVMLESLPLSKGGWLDEDALPEPVEDRGPARHRSEGESRIGAICSQLLGLPEVDPDADFFLLGGRSLLATRLVAEVGRVFGVHVPVAQFMRHPTVAHLAQAVEQARQAAAVPDTPRPSARRNADTLLATLDGLSDDEVAQLLSELKGMA